MRKSDINYEFVKKDAWLDQKNNKTANGGASLNNSSDVSLLSCKGVSKTFGNTTALYNVSLEVSRGKIIGLLGPNGSGKTTLIKLIAGLLTLDSGKIRVLGKDIGVETKKLVSYLPERNCLPLNFTVGDALGFYKDFFADFDKKRAEKILADLSIEKNKKIKSLSKGAKEKVGLALVMSRRAELYLLDEPISGVDPASRDYIIDTVIKNIPQNSSVIISTHLISDIEKIMDEFIFVKYGEIYAKGTPEQIQEKYGKSVDVYFREVFRC